ncbi:MAG: hypothetical protein KatS3mg056_1333 [Chloroflexus sp.]|nr:MAG: hypothetical protein KatS3mg056_1333 [Chloroflexus sp.]
MLFMAWRWCNSLRNHCLTANLAQSCTLSLWLSIVSSCAGLSAMHRCSSIWGGIPARVHASPLPGSRIGDGNCYNSHLIVSTAGAVAFLPPSIPRETAIQSGNGILPKRDATACAAGMLVRCIGVQVWGQGDCRIAFHERYSTRLIARSVFLQLRELCFRSHRATAPTLYYQRLTAHHAATVGA